MLRFVQNIRACGYVVACAFLASLASLVTFVAEAPGAPRTLIPVCCWAAVAVLAWGWAVPACARHLALLARIREMTGEPMNLRSDALAFGAVWVLSLYSSAVYVFWVARHLAP